MKRELAENLMRAFQAYGALFNEMTELSSLIEDSGDREAIRKSAAASLLALSEGVLDTVCRHYPDLRPE